MEQNTRQDISVTAEQAGVRLDYFLAAHTNLTRSAAARLAAEGLVTVNGGAAGKSLRLDEGDMVSLFVPPPALADILPEDIPLEVIYEDGDIIVINKAQGMASHPSAGEYSGTLVNALLHRCGDSLSGINGVLRPGIVHRLDRDTAGLIVAAKNDDSHLGLAAQFKAYTVDRIYDAIVHGNIKEDSSVIDLPLGRSRKDFRKIAVFKYPDEEKKIRRAVTHLSVSGRYTYKNIAYTRAEFRLETGRTHQIRVHSAHLGYPVIGDKLYGIERVNALFPRLKGQCLYSRALKFTHPLRGEEMRFEIEPPGFFSETLNAMEGFT